MSVTPRRLSDVPEEGSFPPTNPHPNNSPYASSLTSAATSSTTLGEPSTSGSTSASRPSSSSKRPPSIRTLGQSSDDTISLGPIVKRKSSSSTTSKDSRSRKAPPPLQQPRFRTIPTLPHDKEAEIAPSTGMYWSRAPVYGTIPHRPMRAHTVTLVDTTAWVFGGWDDREYTKGIKTIYCFDIETMQWTQRDTTGDIPPPSRAHTATLIDRKIVIFGGGLDDTYYNSVYILDTTTRHWSRPAVTEPLPTPRRSHSAVLYNHKIYIFGGGTGVTALNDVWALDVSQPHKMKWEEIKTSGMAPKCRGYHTASLIGRVMIVVGGSDGNGVFDDVWLLNLETRVWKMVRLDPDISRPEMSRRRIAHCATQVGSFLFITGGFDNTKYCSELIPFNLISLQFEKRTTYGKRPSGRGYHATVLADSRLFLFGGYDGTTSHEEVWILDLAAGAYLPQVTSFNIDFESSNLIG